jgi:hypothetical protein
MRVRPYQINTLSLSLSLSLSLVNVLFAEFVNFFVGSFIVTSTTETKSEMVSFIYLGNQCRTVTKKVRWSQIAKNCLSRG